MRNRVIRFLDEFPKNFSTDELAFYSLTNKFELHLRDKLAYLLQYQLKKFQVLREWKNIDISIHRNGIPQTLIEIKYSPVAYLLRRNEKQKSPVLKGLKRDFDKCKSFNARWYGIILLSIPQQRIDERYKIQVRNLSCLNKYVDHYKSKRQWRVNLKSTITEVFPENKFRIKGNLLGIGSWFDTQVDLAWFLISET